MEKENQHHPSAEAEKEVKQRSAQDLSAVKQDSANQRKAEQAWAYGYENANG